MADLGELRERMRQFSAERDWGQFHDPKSVLLALVGEVGELAELFQWLAAGGAQDRTGSGAELTSQLRPQEAARVGPGGPAGIHRSDTGTAWHDRPGRR